MRAIQSSKSEEVGGDMQIDEGELRWIGVRLLYTRRVRDALVRQAALVSSVVSPALSSHAAFERRLGSPYSFILLPYVTVGL